MATPLSEDHNLQVQGYLRFAKFKRKQHLREVGATVSDFAEYRVQENEVYTTKEARALLADCREAVLQRVETELENATYASGLLLHLLFEQAEMADLVMTADTNELENEMLLKRIAQSAEEAMAKPASLFARKPQRLNKLGADTVSDARVLHERDSLRSQVKALEEKVRELNLTAAGNQSAAEAGEVARVREQLEESERALAAERAKAAKLLQSMQASAASGSTGGAKELEEMKLEFTLEAEEKERQHAGALAEAKKKNKKLKAELDKLTDDVRLSRLEASKAGEAANAAEGRLSESKQFQQMRKIMQQKSEEVTKLRRRLAKYEPEDVADADA